MATEGREYAESLLLAKENHYVQGCPGCKIDRQKALNSGLPIKQVFIVWTVVLSSGLTISSLFPFLYFMIRDFHIAETEEDIGYYAGFIGSAYMFGRVLTSLLWGIIADTYGRKPVIIIGCASIFIFNTLFGLSVNYWMAIATRFLLGALNGLLGPIKAYACESVREEHQSIVLSAISTAWGTGLIIGPALGGFLAQETLHNHNSEETSYDAMESATQGSDTKRNGMAKTSILKNWPLLSSILVYCVFSLHDMTYTEIFPLWAESPRRLGGLGYTTGDVGTVLAISGYTTGDVGGLVFVPYISHHQRRLFLFQIMSIPLLTSYPYIAMLSGVTLAIVLNCASVVKNVLSVSIITGLFILQNRSVDQDQRGVANGLSMMLMSIFKAAGPAGGGALFSWGQKRMDSDFLPGNHMIFFLLNIVEAIGVLMTFRPFLVERRET